MAIAIDLASITEEIKKEIFRMCLIKPSSTQFCPNPEPLYCFSVDVQENIVYLPMGIWKNFLEEFPKYEYLRTKVYFKKDLYTLETDPKGYRDQDLVANQVMAKLKKDNVAFIACPAGFGKTTMGNYFSCLLGMKTVVLCHIDKVNGQWVEEFEKFSSAKVQRVRGKTLDPEADVYVMGVKKASLMDRSCFYGIGLIILDEAHIATATAFTKALLKFQPKYVIGLSATPNRPDGLTKVLTMYFGNKKEFITRFETKSFTVYKVQTPYEPEISYNFFQGKTTINWTTLVNSLAYNKERQDYICSLVEKHPEHRIMILSDRKDECKSIYEKIMSKEKNVLLMTGEKLGCKFKGCSKKAKYGVKVPIRCRAHKISGMVDIDKLPTTSYRVLVAGMKKAGVGFNDPTLTMLILATDKKDVIQLEGRIRTVDNIIYDLVDNNRSLENHWKIREDWYVKRGASIEIINLRSGEYQEEDKPRERKLKPLPHKK